jgi:biotin operon repressor
LNHKDDFGRSELSNKIKKTMTIVNNPFETILSELSEIRADLKKLKHPEITVHLPDSLTRDQAIEHLREKGLPMERSQFYKQTANGTIPSQRIGKRLILSRNELNQWVESLKYRRVTPQQKAVKLLADSATKRIVKIQA